MSEQRGAFEKLYQFLTRPERPRLEDELLAVKRFLEKWGMDYKEFCIAIWKRQGVFTSGQPATCPVCKKPIMKGGCIFHNYGETESVTHVAIRAKNYCYGCGAEAGECHHLGCPREECPKCGGQLISCGCFEFFWPEAREHGDGLWDEPSAIRYF